jgi:crotonobetainyl-CoA:carnitine CoA-transferase CaiB-like acyl-CoA transferase
MRRITLGCLRVRGAHDRAASVAFERRRRIVSTGEDEYELNQGGNGNELPLAGTRVLDLTRALSGPFCTALLGDLGADVVKVEPPAGELCRKFGPYQGSESLYFVAVNRNKRSIAIDMWSDAGREVLKTMVGQFDVLVENFRPGVLDALLGLEWLNANHPELIVTSISGFGHVGPRSGEACFDQIAQGMGGFMSLTGTLESGPMRSGIPLADILSGIFAALGVCASLAGRRRGQSVQTSLLEGILAVLTFQGQQYLSLGEVPEPAGNDHPVTVPYGVFPTADHPINLAAATDGQWHGLCELIGAPELATDDRFATPRKRFENKRALIPEIDARLKLKPASEWLAALKEAHIPSGPINDLAQTFSEPQVEALGVVQEVTHSTLGAVPVARGPVWIGGSAPKVRRAAPMLGQHTVDILSECGYAREVIDGLIDQGTVASANGIRETVA